MTFHFAVANHAEYTSAIGEGRAPRVRLVQEWLGQRLDTLPRVGSGEEYRLLPHCTEHTTALSAVRDWQSVFSAFGFTLKVLPLGCRGMAGTWGHEAEHRALSERIYALSWARHVADAGGGGWLVADGYSCRSQVKIIDGIRLAHPVQALLASLRAAASKERPKTGHETGRQERVA
jgi:Fe-S oxidoreductase